VLTAKVAAIAKPIVTDHLSKTYPGGVEAVRKLSIEVDEGEVFGLLGPNGAGKTTTLGVLTTLVRPTGGAAFVDGHDVVRDPFGARQSLGVVFQESVLDNEFTAAENMWLHARVWRVPDAAARIRSLLEAVGLAERAGDGVMTFSGGMRRRLEIARALLGSPRVLVLDEPTLGLDPVVRYELWQMVRELRSRQRLTVLVSTHYLEEAASVCDRVAIIDHGVVTAEGTPTRLVDELGHEVLEVQVDGDAAPVIDALRQIGRPIRTGSTVSAASREPVGTLTDRANTLGLPELGVTSMTVRPATLNDVFLHLNGVRP
jgi:ABC-2 type transport system ATP-binding protein